MPDKRKYKHWRLETDDENIIWCHIDVRDSSVNVLSAEVLQELGYVVEQLQEQKPRGVIFLSDKKNGFIAGAKIEEFIQITDIEQAYTSIKPVHALFEKIENLPFPTLSLINGFCLGGGLEFALACRYRVALDTPETRIGLPEVRLGIHPGFGGTVRMIRQAGPIQGLQLIMTGRSLDARKARRLGLVDRAVPERQLNNAARSLVVKQPPRKKAGSKSRLLAIAPCRKLIAGLFRKKTTALISPDHYPAPYAVLDLWERYGSNEQDMFAAEARSIAELVVSPTSRNLVRLYMLQERLKSAGKNPDYNPRHVHVVGAGVMGGDIAAWCALQGMTVTLQDREPRFIAPAIKRAHALFRKKLKQPHAVTAAMDRLIPIHNPAGVEKADIVIEAIIEDVDAKITLFKELEPRLMENTVLATNTSSIALEILSKHLQQPERLVGIHFFNPVAKMQLVEIIHAANTTKEWLARAAAFCTRISRLPIHVKSSPGFLVNRVLTPYLHEATIMLEEGIPAAIIDRAATDFGMPIGPIELADTVGLDICQSVARNMAAKLNITVSGKLQQMVDAGKLGKKSGTGFYRYKKGKPQKMKIDTTQFSGRDIEERLILRILNECVACLDETLVDDAEILDAGMVFGTGFAPFRGGPLCYAKTAGIEHIIERLDYLTSRYGDRFTADKYWQKLINV